MQFKYHKAIKKITGRKPRVLDFLVLMIDSIDDEFKIIWK